MIARIWKGQTTTEDADEYARYMEGTGLREYRGTPGNRAAVMIRRDLGARTEFLMFTLWDSMASIAAFAGDDPEVAVFYPEDERFLVHADPTVTHYEVAAALGDLGEPARRP